MKRKWKLLTVFSLVLMLGLAVTGLASADVIRGKGTLNAEGSGAATLRMSGQVEITSHGSGVVYIYGAEKIRAEGNGKRTDRGRLFILRGHEGKISITGERMVVRIVGQEIEFDARGKGTAILRGRGTYETGNGRTGDWEPNGLTVSVEEEE
jgi:hypothetical protein